MNNIINIIKILRKRDLAIFILVIISIYLSYYDKPSIKYIIEPAWFIDNKNINHHHQKLNNDKDLNNPYHLPFRYGIDNYKLIPPIITDLEGDGINEIILITNDFKLKVSKFYYDNYHYYHHDYIYHRRHYDYHHHHHHTNCYSL